MSRLKLLGEQEGDGTDDHSALSNLGYAQSGHTGFVPSQGEALIDILRLNQNLIRDSAGNNRITLSAASPHLTLTGATKISERAAIGGVAVNNNVLLMLQPVPNPSTNYFQGLVGAPVASIPSGSLGGLIVALSYQLAIGGGGGGAVVDKIAGVYVKLGQVGYAGTVTNMKGVEVDIPIMMGSSATINTYTGADLQGAMHSHIVDAYGLRIRNITNNTGFTRLLEIGPDTPYLRLLGGTDPPVNKSNLFLKFGSTLYRVIKTGEYMTLEAA
jgi:hypothetical protein